MNTKTMRQGESFTEDEEVIVNDDEVKQLDRDVSDKKPPPVKKDDEDDAPLDDQDSAAPDDDHDSDQGDQDDRDDSLASKEDQEEIRSRRKLERQRRKARQRLLMEQKDARIAALQSRVSQLEKSSATVSHRIVENDIAQIDNAIREARSHAALAEQKITESLAEGDHQKHAQALNYLLASREREKELKGIKTAVESANRQKATQRPTIDPQVANLAKSWMSRNRWYDPAGGDDDSAIVITLDRRLANKGFDPSTPQYWSALDAEISRYLPHRVSRGGRRKDEDMDDDLDEVEDKPRRRQVVSGGNGASPPGKNSYVLSSERVRALKMAGKWDDPEARKRAIAEFKRWDAENKGRS